MATKKTRKKTGMINLTTLRRLAKKAFGRPSQIIEEFRDTWAIYALVETLEGDRALSVVRIHHPDRATARRMLKAALEATLKG